MRIFAQMSQIHKQTCLECTEREKKKLLHHSTKKTFLTNKHKKQREI